MQRVCIQWMGDFKIHTSVLRAAGMVGGVEREKKNQCMETWRNEWAGCR